MKCVERLTAAAALFAILIGTVDSSARCKDILAQNANASSGIYAIRSPLTGVTIQVYCEMGLNGGGYTFINPTFLPSLTNGDIQAMFTDTKSFLMRVRKTDGTQPYIILSQLPQYESIPLKLGLNEQTSYNAPVNAPIIGSPYLYFGFLPISQAINNNVQGLQVNENSLSFTNCDKNPNSQITLFTNFHETSPSSYAFNTTWPLCHALFALALDNPSGRVMPVEYFMFTETHWGGCGCYTQSDARLKPQGILSTAIGFR